MGKTKTKQPKKSNGCIAATRLSKRDGAKASCLGKALNLLDRREIFSIGIDGSRAIIPRLPAMMEAK